MRYILLFSLFFIGTASCAQQSSLDPKTYQPPYQLTMTQGWDVERFPIPIDFAPAIPYKGVEDIRFTPGWGKTGTAEYWSYAFLWNLEGNVMMDEKIIADNLTAYYTGLIGRNIEKRKIPADKLFPVKAVFKAIAKTKGDIATYQGTVHMLDYMDQKPMVLNGIVHLKSGGPGRTYVFYEISPQPLTHSVWNDLNKLWSDFTITK